jgi:hypothetical protein
MKLRFEVEIWLFERRKFNPNKWLKKQKSQKQIQEPVTVEMKGPVRIQHEVEVITRRVENFQLDLTYNYEKWLKLAFAFANEFGSAGRNYFHRISKFHPEYDPAKCDEQFDKCLRRGKSGVTIKSFFQAAKDAGVNIRV